MRKEKPPRLSEAEAVIIIPIAVRQHPMSGNEVAVHCELIISFHASVFLP